MIEIEAIEGEVDGLRSLFIVSTVPEDAPAAVREILARRRLAILTGQCPCGARRPKLSRQIRRQISRGGAPPESAMHIEHETGCPAPDEDDLVAAWAATARRPA